MYFLNMKYFCIGGDKHRVCVLGYISYANYVLFRTDVTVPMFLTVYCSELMLLFQTDVLFQIDVTVQCVTLPN